MPEIFVNILEGKSPEQKRGLVKDITDAVVKNLNTKAEYVTIQINESPRHNKAKGGQLYSDAQ